MFSRQQADRPPQRPSINRHNVPPSIATTSLHQPPQRPSINRHNVPPSTATTSLHQSPQRPSINRHNVPPSTATTSLHQPPQRPSINRHNVPPSIVSRGLSDADGLDRNCPSQRRKPDHRDCVVAVIAWLQTARHNSLV